MKRHLLLAICTAVVVLAVTGAARAQSDPRAGTWTLNVAKSKYNPGPPPASETRTYTAQGHGVSVSIESVDAKGGHVSLRYTAQDDGKDYPMSGLTLAEAIAMRRVDSNTFDVDTKKNGKVIGTTRGQVSKDGKILTLTSKMVTPAGQTINNVAVFDKH